MLQTYHSSMWRMKGLILLLLVYIDVAMAAKILMIPMDHRSHVNLHSEAGKGLREAGHQVWVLTSNSTGHQATVERAKLTPILVYPSPEAHAHTRVAGAVNQALQGNISYVAMSSMPLGLINFCREVMANDTIIAGLEELHLDLAVVDGVPPFRCMFTLPYRLSIPYMVLTPLVDPWTVGVPAMPTFEPVQILTFTNQMTFMEKVATTMAYFGVSFIMPMFTDIGKELTEKYVPSRPPITSEELYAKSEMWLINLEVNCFDYPRISAPHYKYIGGLSGTPSKPLPKDIAAFADGAKAGLIVMTFGSIKALAQMPEYLLRRFLNAFARLKQHVVVRYEGEPVKDVPSNVLLLNWVPQNDLLGHPNTKLFIAHGGNNGQLEALYHGVPSLIFPILGDQAYSAARVIAKGFGRKMDITTFTSDELHDTVVEMIHNTSYRENIKKCSEIVRQLPSSVESTVFWVNHVIKFGGAHLRPPSMDMSIFQMFSLDIVLFFQAVTIFFMVLSFKCCKCCFRWCCRRTKITKKKAE